MMVDPQQATDAFLALSQAAATAGGAAAAAKASGAAAASQAAGTASAKASAAASAAAVGAGGLSVESLLKQLAGVQAAISALPAVVLKDPAIKSALASLQGIAGALQGEEAKVIKTLQSIPQVKQLQGELIALAKTLEGYKQAASAQLSVETLIRQLPAPLQTIEKMAAIVDKKLKQHKLTAKRARIAEIAYEKLDPIDISAKLTWNELHGCKEDVY